MKKFIITTMIILVGMMYMTANAQSVIVKGGNNLSTLAEAYSDESSASKMLSGFHAGVAIDIPVSDALSVETGIFFSTRGNKLEWEEDDSFFDGTWEETNTYSYLELPVTAKVRFPVAKNLTIYTQAGGYISYGLSAESTFTQDDIGFIVTNDWNDESQFDAGATVGAGVEFGRVLIGASYDYGLTKMPYDWINRNLKFSVGYTIASGK